MTYRTLPMNPGAPEGLAVKGAMTTHKSKDRQNNDQKEKELKVTYKTLPRNSCALEG